MYDTLPFLNRARRLSSLAVLSVALVAACSTDETVAPKKPAANPEAAQPQLLPPGQTGSIVIKLFDQNKNLITGQYATGFEIKSPSGTIWWANDNVQNDADSTWGVLVLKSLAPGLYRVCAFSTPYGYGVVGQTCRYPTVYAGSSTGAFFDYGPEALLKWDVIDNAMNPISGTTFRVDSTNVPFWNVTDNVPPDVDPASGKFNIPIRFEATWKVCVDKVPAGYVIAPNQPACVSKDVVMNSGWDVGPFWLVPIYSAHWTVTDGVNAIGPSTFAVQTGATKITVVDNGMNDYDTTLGKIAVKLPSAGDYSVCETVPPVNHWNANPSCHSITVSAGVPGAAGYFTNYVKVLFPATRG
jgi:hypothetical protein